MMQNKHDKYIISASKRTDIPAFYSDWFVNRIKAGYAMYRNPFNIHQGIKVSLKPEDILAVCFWTRNPEPLIKYFDFLREKNINFYFQFTINNYPRYIDPSTPDSKKMIDVFKRIVDKLSVDHVSWRYDPILFTNDMSSEWHLNNFGEISNSLKGYTKRCYISYVDFYSKTNKKFKELQDMEGIRIFDKSEVDNLIIPLTSQLLESSLKNDIEVYYCNEKKIEQDNSLNNKIGLNKASCVDIDLIHKLFPNTVNIRKRSNKMDACGCYPSKDIGAYDTCLYKCVYCYANLDFEKKSKERMYSHNPNSEYLIEEKSNPSIITDLTNKKNNPTLFDED